MFVFTSFHLQVRSLIFLNSFFRSFVGHIAFIAVYSFFHCNTNVIFRFYVRNIVCLFDCLLVLVTCSWSSFFLGRLIVCLFIESVGLLYRSFIFLLACLCLRFGRFACLLTHSLIYNNDNNDNLY